MKPTPTAPNPVYGLRQLLAVTVSLVAATLLVFVAIDYPAVVAGVLAATALTAVATTVALDYRRKVGRTRRVCVPKTGICVDA